MYCTVLYCTSFLSAQRTAGSDGQAEQLDAAEIRGGEKCTVLRVKPEPCDAAFFAVVRERIDVAFVWHAVVG